MSAFLKDTISMNDTEQKSSMPPGWLVAVFGGVSGAVSALVFQRALVVGLGAGGGVLLFFALYWGIDRLRT